MRKFPNLETISLILGSCVLLASVVAFLVIGIPSMSTLMDGEEVTATVTDNIIERNRKGHAMYRAVYGYDYHGRHYEAKGRATSSVPAAEGSEAPVYVNPQNPSEAEAASDLAFLITKNRERGASPRLQPLVSRIAHTAIIIEGQTSPVPQRKAPREAK